MLGNGEPNVVQRAVRREQHEAAAPSDALLQADPSLF